MTNIIIPRHNIESMTSMYTESGSLILNKQKQQQQITSTEAN